jgi:hypothetical protein
LKTSAGIASRLLAFWVRHRSNVKRLAYDGLQVGSLHTNIVRASVVAISMGAAIAGCASKPEAFPTRHHAAELAYADDAMIPATQRSDLHTFSHFSLYASPPEGWTMKDNTGDPRVEHVIWTSPSGNTAFGTIFFTLPFPFGHDITFNYGFLAEARRREGSAEVIEKHWDPEIEGLRFTVKTPRFTVEAKFFVRGKRGWAAYAGTKTTQPVNEAELQQARQAREDAEFGEEIVPTKTEPPPQQLVQ